MALLLRHTVYDCGMPFRGEIKKYRAMCAYLESNAQRLESMGPRRKKKNFLAESGFDPLSSGL